MFLDEGTIASYSALDSATLLALLPALRYEAERTKEETETFERVRQAIPDPNVGVAEVLSESIMVWERRLGGSEGELGKVLDRLERYRADLQERERWIWGELVRRGLLPEYPFWGER